jgi:hypothetical protein
MAGLLIILAWIAAAILAALAFLSHTGTGVSAPAWCGWLAVLIIAVLGCIGAFGDRHH